MPDPVPSRTTRLKSVAMRITPQAVLVSSAFKNKRNKVNEVRTRNTSHPKMSRRFTDATTGPVTSTRHNERITPRPTILRHWGWNGRERVPFNQRAL